MSEPFKIKRTERKDTPNRVTALWLLGAFLLISIPYLGITFGNVFYGDWGMWTYIFALMFSLFVGGMIAWFTLIIKENAQDIQIRVVQQK